MITDFQILGIEETSDPHIIKNAYRKRVKETHPDNSTEKDMLKNHLLFIQINQAYQRLRKNLMNSQPESFEVHNEESANNGIVKHQDPRLCILQNRNDLLHENTSFSMEPAKEPV
jgi:DnaJ-class molecular chaperone